MRQDERINSNAAIVGAAGDLLALANGMANGDPDAPQKFGEFVKRQMMADPEGFIRGCDFLLSFEGLATETRAFVGKMKELTASHLELVNK